MIIIGMGDESLSEQKIQAVSAQDLLVQQEYAARVKSLIMSRYPHPPLAFVHSFGCQQNQSDGEKIKGMLAEMGYGFTDETDHADFVIYNTCAVRENAQDRVFGNVGALKPIKQEKPNMLIGLCGCMMQQQSVSEKIKKSYPYVDLVFGTHALHLLPELLFHRLSGDKRQFSNEDCPGKIVEGLPLRRDGNIKANLPVTYGCDNFCSYCIVPYVRGRERSRKSADVLLEANDLVRQGYREITLLGQNVNSYGKGLSEQIDFSDLIRQINQIDGDFQIRFMTSHPKDCTKKLIDTIAECKKVCRHIHLPVQSGCNRILKVMNRNYTVESYLELIDYARKRIPNITFSSDIIVGFPGDSYDDFLETVELIKRVRYHTLYTFIYSPRGGTKAALMEDPVPVKEKSKWLRELLAVQDEIRGEVQNALIGKTIRVLADGEGRSGEGWISARSDSNDIVEFIGPKETIGCFVNVEIERALNWASFGKLK